MGIAEHVIATAAAKESIGASFLGEPAKLLIAGLRKRARNGALRWSRLFGQVCG